MCLAAGRSPQAPRRDVRYLQVSSGCGDAALQLRPGATRPRTGASKSGERWSSTARPVTADALNFIVVAYQGLAYSLASRFAQRGEDIEDLNQVALIGLLKAVERFDLARGTELTTFATATILGELKRHLRDRGWWVRPPRRVHDLYISTQQAIDELTQRYGQVADNRRGGSVTSTPPWRRWSRLSTPAGCAQRAAGHRRCCHRRPLRHRASSA